MERFCYWQEDTPKINQSFYKVKKQKICLLRLNEYKISKENGIKNTISIFCPYIDKKEAIQCLDYFLIKDIK